MGKSLDGWLFCADFSPFLVKYCLFYSKRTNMAQRRHSVQKIKDIVRLKRKGLSHQQVADALKVSKGSVFKVFSKFNASGTQWSDCEVFSDQQWNDLIYPSKQALTEEKPDFASIIKELARPNVTLQLLWEEYRKENPKGLGRTAFYDAVKRYRGSSDITMKIIHKGGDKLYVDYSGDAPGYIDKATGEVIKTQIFVASFGASSYTFAEATATQNQEDWVGSHVRAFEYFGGLPNAVVPDNLKSGVIKPSIYEPELNLLYSKMAEHYDIAILPARVRKPQDKAVVESNVLVVQRRILASLRNREFFSLAEINEAIKEELIAYNNRSMKDYDGDSRKERFEALDKPYLKGLPAERFKITEIKMNVRVQKNYHVQYDKHFYSCPWNLVGELVNIFRSGSIIEIYHKGKHVCRHPKKPPNYMYQTSDDHMPPTHLYTKGLSPEWFLSKGREVGPSTVKMIEEVMTNRRHPEQGFNAAQGILRLGKQCGYERLELACKRCIYFQSYSYKFVKSVLDQNLDDQDYGGEGEQTDSIENQQHGNIRGSQYYLKSQQRGE
jgi:transposase